MSRTLKSHLLSLLLALTPITGYVHADDSGDSSQKNEECNKALKNVNQGLKAAGAARKAGASVTPSSEGQNAAAQAGVDAAAQTAGANAGAQMVCKKVADLCKPVCEEGTKGKPTCDRVQAMTQELGAAVDGANQAGEGAQQTADATGSEGAPGGGAGMDPSAMSGLLGAAAGMLGAMMNKKKDQKPQQMPQLPQPQPQDGALLPNGAIDCSKPDAHRYSACNDHLVQDCMGQMGTARCNAFSDRYCGSTTPVNLGDGAAASSSGSGEGRGSQFCRTVMATNFCKQAGRSNCPSCLQLAAFNSPACRSNPAMCVAQNSPDQINQARQTCPTDPAFSDPAFANVGGGSQLPPPLRNEPTNPPVLPPLAGGGSSSGGTSGGTTAGGSPQTPSGGGVSTFSAASASAVATASEESAVGSAAREGGGGSVGSYVASSGRSAAVRPPAGAGAREVQLRGPASDVHGAYGPSVFATGSQTLRARCEAGKLLGCP